MARVMGIDFGLKRVGVAVTDPLQIIGSPLDTIDTKNIYEFLALYMRNNEVEAIVVGEPLHLDGQPAQIHAAVMEFVRKVQEQFPMLQVTVIDERFTSHLAKNIILQSVKSKKDRRNKGLIDKVSASLILQDYMQSIGTWKVF